MWDILKSKVAGFISKIKGESEKSPEVENGLGEVKEAEAVPEKRKIVEQESKEGLEKTEVRKTAVREPEIRAAERGKPGQKATEKTEVRKTVAEEREPELKEKIVSGPEGVIEREPYYKDAERKPEEEKPAPKRQDLKDSGGKPETGIIGKLGKAREPAQPPPSAVGRPTEAESIKVRLGLTDKIKRAVLRKIRLEKGKVAEITDELEFSLIQADVHPDVAASIALKVRDGLAEREFSRNDIENEVREVLRSVFAEEAFGEESGLDILEVVRGSQKPCRILFLGPNGAGKTTTIAKVAHMLMKEGLTVVISASDTFRAAAIEQSEEHGRRLGVRVIRHQYGGDAAAVAFDAIRHAEANGIDAVLIDSAGRQDTNQNLLKELQKLERIAKPHLKLFVGESISGNSLYQQVASFKEWVGLDGVILTKIDCDSKGGTAISILKETGVPILYMCAGQGYDDIYRFSPDIIISKII